jgi:hypothetical protein
MQHLECAYVARDADFAPRACTEEDTHVISTIGR